MAPGVRAPDGTLGAELLLEPAHAFVAVAHRRCPATAGAGLPERRPRFIPGRAARQGRPAEAAVVDGGAPSRSEEHTSELQSRGHLVCRLLLEKKKKTIYTNILNTNKSSITLTNW